MSICEVKNLCKEYPSFSLENISFSLEPGTITGFIGANGSGKTTTIKSMLNLIHPSKGEVYFFDMPFKENECIIKQRIGFSAGNVHYYQKKKLSDIAAVTKTFYDNWDDDEYYKYLKMFSLDESKALSELSEGMKVKWNLLLALSHHAEVLILDEPTSSLDPFSRDELTELFSFLKEQGTAILFSTHITSDIEKCADRIIYIRGGKVVITESKENFLTKLAKDGESLEQAILRLEKEARNEKTAL